MKKTGFSFRPFLAALFFFLSAVLSTAAVGAVYACRGKSPVLLDVPEEAVRQVELLMDAVCCGNFAEAEQLLYGTPDLGTDAWPEDPVAAMIWDAYVGSLDYILVGEPYPSDTGMVQDVKVISLEMSTVTENLGGRAGRLLQQAIDSAEDVSQLYDENNAYRKDLVEGVLKEATRQALEEDVRYTYRILPLQMILRDGRWQVAADQLFLDTVAGRILEMGELS